MTELIREYERAISNAKSMFIIKLREIYLTVYVVNVTTSTGYGDDHSKSIGCFSDYSRAKDVIGNGYREFYSFPDGGETSIFTVTPTETATIEDFNLLIKIDEPIDMSYYGHTTKLLYNDAIFGQ